MDNQTKLELINAITSCTDSNEYDLAEKLLEVLGVRIVDTLEKEPLDLFCEDELIKELESIGYEISLNKQVEENNHADKMLKFNQHVPAIDFPEKLSKLSIRKG